MKILIGGNCFTVLLVSHTSTAIGTRCPLPWKLSPTLRLHPTPLSCHRLLVWGCLHPTANSHWLSNFTRMAMYIALLLYSLHTSHLCFFPSLCLIVHQSVLQCLENIILVHIPLVRFLSHGYNNSKEYWKM